MVFARSIVASVLCLGLAACQPAGTATPVAANSDLAALDAATVQFTETLALATVMSDRCSRQGIVHRQSNVRSIGSFFNVMKSRGYTQTQINAAVDRMDRQSKDAIARKAIRYMESRGALGGDAVSFCNVARREISEGTAVGNLLRTR